MKQTKQSHQSAGGKARAASLTPEARLAIAQTAARTRWGTLPDSRMRLIHAIIRVTLPSELVPWATLLPEEFFRGLFQVLKLDWDTVETHTRPILLGAWVSQLVFERLPELPEGKQGRKMIEQHAYAILGLMRIADSPDHLKVLVEKAYPHIRAVQKIQLV